MDIRKVRYFLRLCETLNFSQTAASLGLSQPALTKAVKRLEEEVGGVLIRREGKHTHLTHLGRLMKEQFVAVDAAASRAELTAKRLVHGDMPQIQIAIMCTIGPGRAQAFLKAFRDANPKVEMVLREAARDKIGPMLTSGFVDCALVGAPIPDEPHLKYTPLYTEPMVVACAKDHPFSKKTHVTMEEVFHEPYLDRLECEFRDTFIAEGQRAGIEIQFAARSEREDWIQTLAQSGLGVSLIPEESVILDGLTTRHVTEPEIKRNVSLVAPYGREDTPLLRKFLTAARQFNWEAAASR